jgi:hypothetical protein
VLGAALDARLSAGDRRATRWLRVSAGLVTSLAVLIGVQGRTGLLTRLAPGLVRTGDPSLELQPWSSVPAAIDEEIRILQHQESKQNGFRRQLKFRWSTRRLRRTAAAAFARANEGRRSGLLPT